MRRPRIKSPISAVTIKRVVAAAERAGIAVSGLEVSPDETIRITSSDPSGSQSSDVFAKWTPRL